MDLRRWLKISKKRLVVALGPSAMTLGPISEKDFCWEGYFPTSSLAQPTYDGISPSLFSDSSLVLPLLPCMFVDRLSLFKLGFFRPDMEVACSGRCSFGIGSSTS